MFWTIAPAPARAGEDDSHPPAHEGRFVMHRHRDAGGPHLDLRIEQPGGYLLGWRIAAESLDAPAWATEKMPHPLHWLDEDGGAVREDAGRYRWIARDSEGGVIALEGRAGERAFTIAPAPGLPADAARAIAETLAAERIPPGAAPGLMRDGVQARHRAIARCCGLGRELDGAHFDEGAWRTALAGLDLEGIHAHLRQFERRFDEKHPPAPVSAPEPLEEQEAADTAAFARLRRLLEG